MSCAYVQTTTSRKVTSRSLITSLAVFWPEGLSPSVRFFGNKAALEEPGGCSTTPGEGRGSARAVWGVSKSHVGEGVPDDAPLEFRSVVGGMDARLRSASCISTTWSCCCRSLCTARQCRESANANITEYYRVVGTEPPWETTTSLADSSDGTLR